MIDLISFVCNNVYEFSACTDVSGLYDKIAVVVFGILGIGYCAIVPQAPERELVPFPSPLELFKERHRLAGPKSWEFREPLPTSVDTPLHKATQVTFVGSSEEAEEVERLLLDGANPNIPNEMGDTPLHNAAGLLCLKRIQSLLKAGARLDVYNRDGQSPLHTAVNTMDLIADSPLDPIELLIQEACARHQQSVFDHQDVDGLTPLSAAAAAVFGVSAVVQRLLEVGANPNICSQDGVPALILAAWRDDSDTVQTLLPHTALVEKLGLDARDPDIVQTVLSHPDVARRLLQNTDLTVAQKREILARTKGGLKKKPDLLALVNTPPSLARIAKECTRARLAEPTV